jgi:PTS system ascorbate-specific IIC component
MVVLNYLVNTVFRQPPLFLGLIALLGLLLQKKGLSDTLKGTLKTVIGVIVLMKGVDIIVASINPLAAAFTSLYAIPASEVISPMGMGGFLTEYGSVVGLVMVLAFIVNLLVARFTPIKNIFLTGHIFFWMSFIFVAVGVETGLSGTALTIFATIFLSIYIVVTPALIRPYVREITGNDSFTIGHTCSLFCLIGSWVGKLFGNKEQSTEELKLPESLDFMRDTTIATGLVMFIVYFVVGLLIGSEARIAAFGGTDVFTFSLMQGLTFGAGLTVLLTGVRLMLGEIIPAFRGIAMKLIPGAIPALDCPMIFPYAPNAVLIGFVVSMIASIATIAILAATGSISYAVIPLTVACFFDIAPGAVFANATGGRRGVILTSILGGVVLILLEAWSIPFLQHTVSDFVQAFGGNDFSLWAIISSFFAGLF